MKRTIWIYVLLAGSLYLGFCFGRFSERRKVVIPSSPDSRTRQAFEIRDRRYVRVHQAMAFPDFQEGWYEAQPMRWEALQKNLTKFVQPQHVITIRLDKVGNADEWYVTLADADDNKTSFFFTDIDRLNRTVPILNVEYSAPPPPLKP